MSVATESIYYHYPFKLQRGFMKNIAESDWKKLRLIKDNTLKISCTNIFEKIDDISNNRKDREHEA